MLFKSKRRLKPFWRQIYPYNSRTCAFNYKRNYSRLNTIRSKRKRKKPSYHLPTNRVGRIAPTRCTSSKTESKTEDTLCSKMASRMARLWITQITTPTVIFLRKRKATYCLYEKLQSELDYLFILDEWDMEVLIKKLIQGVWYS